MGCLELATAAPEPAQQEVVTGPLPRFVPQAQRHRFNHAIFIVATSLVLPVVATGVGLLVTLSFANPNAFPTGPAIVGIGMTGIGPFAMIPVHGYCSAQIIARRSGECWSQDVSPASVRLNARLALVPESRVFQ